MRGTGVVGISDLNFGVLGQSSLGVGIRGIAFGASAAGVEGVASGSGPGVWGFTSSGHAILGNSTSGNGGVFSSSTGYGLSVSTTSGAVGVFAKSPAFAFSGQGSLTCTGTGHFGGGVVVMSRTADGSLRGTVGMTAPVALVEDVGRARLIDGVARVDLDPMFVGLTETADYEVFPVARADCRGLFITNQTPTSFEIRELGGGTSSIDVGYRVVAKRAGSRARFARVEEPPPAPTFPEMPHLPKRSDFEAERGPTPNEIQTDVRSDRSATSSSGGTGRGPARRQ
jgi:hypothetical protein